MKGKVADLLPLLSEGYAAIEIYQKHRMPEATVIVESYLLELGQALQVFKAVVQINKQDYFDVVLDTQLNLSDRIIALDTAVGAMHIEFAVSRSYMHRESADLKRALEEARVSSADIITPRTPDSLCTGIPASAGLVTGKVKRIRKDSDYKHVPSGAIIVAEMTRPELVYGLDRAAGIITDIGGVLCHAAIVAREQGIPCVVGTGNATKVLPDQLLVEVNGEAGTVRRAENRHFMS